MYYCWYYTDPQNGLCTLFAVTDDMSPANTTDYWASRGLRVTVDDGRYYLTLGNTVVELRVEAP